MSLLSPAAAAAAGEAAAAAGLTPPRKPRDKQFGRTPIHALPTELLTHIFAQLPPASLAIASLVSKQWHQLVSDEASWRSAFENYYRLGAEGTRIPLGRRLEPTSWRAEYITRVSLLSRYSKSRSPSTSYSPSLGPITHLSLLPTTTSSQTPPTLLTLSLPLATSSLSNPFTGRLSKSTQPATPVNNLGQPLLPPVQVTSYAVQKEGAGSGLGRVIWGCQDGGIRVSNSPVGSTSSRGNIGSGAGEVRQIQDQPHREGTPVLALSFAQVDQGVKSRGDRFVSVGQDGWVHLWVLDSVTNGGVIGSALLPRERAPVARRIWSGRLPTPIGVEQTVATRVELDSGYQGKRKASIAVGMSDGAVVVWVGIPEEGEEQELGRRYELAAEGGAGSVDTLRFDSSYSEGKIALLVHSQGARFFHRYIFPSSSSSDSNLHLDFEQPTQISKTTFGHSHPDLLHEITAFAFDFALPPPAPSPSSSSTPNKGSTIRSFTPHSRSTSHTSTPLDTPTLEEPPTLSFPSPLAPSTSDTTNTGTRSKSHQQFGSRKMVVAGDRVGRVFLWDWEREISEEEGTSIVEPSKMIQGLVQSKVTALELGEAVVMVGTLDGTLRLYCPLTALLLRTFRERTAPRHPSRLLAQNLIPVDEEDRWKVNAICKTGKRGEVVAAVGDRVLSWRMEGTREVKTGKGKGKSGVQRLSARSERFRSDQELRHQVLESLDSLTVEQSSRIARLGHERHLITSFGLPPSLENMTEDEAVALALMLSAEEEEGRWFAGSASASGSGNASGRSSARQSPEWEPVPEELLLEMDGLSLDSDRGAGRSFGNQQQGDVDDQDDYLPAPSPSISTSRSLSLSVPTSPTLRGSSLGPSSSSSSHGSPSPRSHHTWRPSPSPSSSLTAAVYEPHSYASSGGSPSNMKVQLSPRLGPTYGSVGRGEGFLREEVPDMSEELWPTAAVGASSSSLLSSTGRAASTLSPADSPSLVKNPTTRTTTPTLNSTSTSPNLAPSTPARRGWSQVARSTPSSSTSPSPIPSSSTPWNLPTSSSSIPRSSGLTDQLRRTERESREDELRRREEEELRFALELSAAEERSRSEV